MGSWQDSEWGMEHDSEIFNQATQKSTQFKTFELFISGILHFWVLDIFVFLNLFLSLVLGHE